jgi:two-component system, OmpR family, response regulator
MDNQKRVLLAEDDKNLGTILKAYLEAKGYQTTLCVDGKEALEKFKREDYTFCILDVMMPVMDGFALAAEIRKLNSQVPLLFLTAKSMQEDKLHGFELGADDYLTKPFSMEELLMRMKAIMRRSEEALVRPTFFEIGSFTFDYNRQILSRAGEDNKLTSKEAELLRLLCENLNRVLDRSVALNKIWFDDSYFNARSMDVYITKLRKYFKNDDQIELMNVHGVGFKLVVNEAKPV